jgi:hypothetical protein
MARRIVLIREDIYEIMCYEKHKTRLYKNAVHSTHVKLNLN